MIFLIRHRNSTTGTRYDAKMSSRYITLGSGFDQHIQLMGAEIGKSHAVLKEDKNAGRGFVRVVALAGKKIHADGQPVGRKTLGPGDEFTLSGHRVKIIEPPEGFDVACELIIDMDQKRAVWRESRGTEFVARTWTPRRLAYGLGLVVFALGFLWPYSAYLNFHNQSTTQGRILDVRTSMAMVAESSLRGDFLWSTGPLLDAHQNAIGDNCSTCHTKAFQAIEDKTCLTCHQQIEQHFDTQFLRHGAGTAAADVDSTAVVETSSSAAPVELHMEINAGENPSCESCHKEHNEPQSIIATVDYLCTECHRDVLEKSNGHLTGAASSFSPGTHPKFRYSMLVARQDDSIPEGNSDNSISWQKVLLDVDSAAKEDSHLEFSHQLHLQLDDPSLICSNCHRLSQNNEHFEMISMENHCSGCHELAFDGRKIPHGDAALAIRSIEEYFIALYVSPDREIEAPLRRLPGKKIRSCEGTDYQCALLQAEEEIQLQFNNSGCVTCHRVSESNLSDVTSGADSGFASSLDGWSPLSRLWAVEAVKINDDWYESARFDHLKHLTQSGQSEIELCSSCHNATHSELSSDVLIPTSENCFQCHDDESNNSITMACVDCHNHHPRGKKAQSWMATNEP